MKKFKNICFVVYSIWISTGCLLFAQDDILLTHLTIPEELKKNADAVVRFDDTEVTLESIDKYVVKNSYAITVLKNDGAAFLKFLAPYKQGSESLSDIHLSYYDGMGKLLKKVKPKNLKDEASSSSIELIGDRRVKTYSYVPAEYPVTIKVTYKKTSKNTMFLPRWMPLTAYDLSIQSSTYRMINNSGLELRWSSRNFDGFSSITSSINEYEMSLQKRLTHERYSPSYFESLPMVIVIPKQYAFEGKQGGHSNWEEYGYNMHRQFLKNKNNLNQSEVRNDIASKVDIDLEKRDLIKALYNYVQEQTRYILITLDDGGFAPLSAHKVHDVKYGDCKALSFYMKSLLGMFGIESNYVQIHADADMPLDIFEDFAHTSPSNHIIINVPMEEDTIWLDCTSHDNPFNYLGSFTDDRLACEIHPEGGKLVRTPRYNLEDNKQIETGEVTIDFDGDINVQLNRESRGLFYENGMRVSKLSKDELDEYIKTNLLEDFNRLDLKSNHFSLMEDEVLYKEDYNFSASTYAELAGNYMLIPLSLIEFPVPRLPKDKSRMNEVYFPRDKSYTRKIIYNIPAGYNWKISKDQVIEDEYGMYKSSVKELAPGTYEVTSVFDLYKGRYAPEEYNKIKRFFDLIRKAERRKFSISSNA